jgi:hypothetical protein
MDGDNVPMLMLVDLEFGSGTLYLCNASYNFDWNGHTYLGAASCGTIEEIPEPSDLSMSGIKMTLSGVDPAKVTIALDEHYQGQPVTIRLAPLDDDYQVIDDPVIVFVGRMDVMEVVIDKTAVITVTAESRLTDWNRASIRRYNHEDQTSVHPTDMFFQYVPQMIEKELLWNVPSPAVTPAPQVAIDAMRNVIHEGAFGGGG